MAVTNSNRRIPLLLSPKDDAWKKAHLAMLVKLGKRAWLRDKSRTSSLASIGST